MRNTNHFSHKFKSKTTEELEEIVANQEDYQWPAVQAAKWELQARAGDSHHCQHLVSGFFCLYHSLFLLNCIF